MKSLLLLLSFCAAAYAGDIRLVGTNLYDFTAATNSIYHVRGEISKVWPQSVEVTPESSYDPDQDLKIASAFRRDVMEGGPEQQLRMLAAFRTAFDDKANLRDLNPNTLMRMSPDMRVAVLAAQAVGRTQGKRMPGELPKYLLHYTNKPAIGQTIDCVAIPTKDERYFDCGITFTGSITNHPIIFCVQSNRIVKLTNACSIIIPTNK